MLIDITKTPELRLRYKIQTGVMEATITTEKHLNIQDFYEEDFKKDVCCSSEELINLKMAIDETLKLRTIKK